MTTVLSYTGAAAQYKYNVLGKTDGLLQTVGNLTSSESGFAAFKRKRIEEKQYLASLGTSAATKDSIKLEKNFLRSALNIVKSAVTSEPEKKGVDSAVVSITAELSSAVSKYNKISVSVRTPEEDAAFISEMKDMMAELKRLNSQQSILSRAEGTVYNATIKGVTKMLKQMTEVLDKIQLSRDLETWRQSRASEPAETPATPPAEDASGTNLDIQV